MPGSDAIFSINVFEVKPIHEVTGSQGHPDSQHSGYFFTLIPHHAFIFTSFRDPVFCFQKTYLKKTNFATKANKWDITVGSLRCQGHSIKQIAFYISSRRKSTIFVLHVCVLTSSSYYRIVSNPFPCLSVSNDMAFLGMLHSNDIKVVLTLKAT